MAFLSKAISALKKQEDAQNNQFKAIATPQKSFVSTAAKILSKPTVASNAVNNLYSQGLVGAGGTVASKAPSGNNGTSAPSNSYRTYGATGSPAYQQYLARKASETTADSGGGNGNNGYYYPSYSSYGAYNSPYAPMMQNALARLQGLGSFSYDYLSDPVYQQYAKQYAIQGRNAMADTMGEYASMTGGLPSSYAVTAGQQAENSYNTALNNMIPQLQEARYQKWMGDYTMTSNLLDQLMNLDQMSYNQYLNDRDYNLNLQQLRNKPVSTGSTKAEDTGNSNADRVRAMIYRTGDISYANEQYDAGNLPLLDYIAIMKEFGNTSGGILG